MRDVATVVSGGAGGASFWYSFMVTKVIGINMMTASIGDHQLRSRSGATIPMPPRMISTLAGTSMNAPGDANSAKTMSMPMTSRAKPKATPVSMVNQNRVERIYVL